MGFIAEKVGCYKVLSPPPAFPPIYHLPPHLIQQLTLTQKSMHTSQTILDCSETNEGFYVKCGYKRTGLEMALYNTDKK